MAASSLWLLWRSRKPEASGKKDEILFAGWLKSLSLENLRQPVWKQCWNGTFCVALKLSWCGRPWHSACYYPVCFPAWPSQSILMCPHSWPYKHAHPPALSLTPFTPCLTVWPTVSCFTSDLSIWITCVLSGRKKQHLYLVQLLFFSGQREEPGWQ